MNTAIRDGPRAIAASVVVAIAPTVKPMFDAADDSTEHLQFDLRMILI
jgi:hypothetical protein